MPRLAEKDLRRIGELDDSLRSMPERAPSTVPDVLDDLAELWRARTGVYWLAATARGVDVDRMALGGTWPISPATARERMSRVIASHAPDWTNYAPLRPPPALRNRAVTLRQARSEMHLPDPARNQIFDELGVADMDCVRVLLCDGPSMLACLGGFRPDTFKPRARQILDALAPALCHRLRLESQLGRASITWAALAATLEAVGAPAYVLDASGHVKHANRAARALLDLHLSTESDLCAAVRGQPGRFDVTRITANGAPDHFLAIAHATPTDPTPRLAHAAARYDLTSRQLEVLTHVVQGNSNKAIAALLCCAENTIELHVSAVLRKVGVESRAALVARVWTGE